MKRPLLLIVLFAVCSSCHWVEHEVHLIPAGYTGNVYIVHNRPDGAPMKREGRARLYEIPADGVLWSQTPTNLGWFNKADLKNYYVTTNGERQPLTHWARPSDATVPDDVVAVYLPGNGSAGQGPNCEVQFDEYYVGTKASLESYREKQLGPYLTAHGLCK
jgi:hypothetical protein